MTGAYFDPAVTVEPLATVEDIAARIGEEIVDDIDVRLAQSMAEAASDHVRHHGGQLWPSRESAPRIARTIAISAAARGFLNPSGFTDERSDSVTLKRAESFAADTQLSPYEIQMLKDLTPRSAVQSIRLDNSDSHWGARSRRGRGFVRRDVREGVPVSDGHTPFPFYRVR